MVLTNLRWALTITPMMLALSVTAEPPCPIDELFHPTQLPTFDTFHAPNSVVTGDFNGDGRPDFATSNIEIDENKSFWPGNTVTVRLATPDGAFGPIVQYDVGEQPRTIGLGDFNGDGQLDLITINWDSKDLSVLRGNPDGTFAPELRFALEATPVAMTTEDLNDDGLADLSVCLSSTDSVAVLFGSPNETLVPGIELSVGDTPWNIDAADIDGDGFDDLAVVVANGSDLRVWRGLGDGQFSGDPLVQDFGVPQTHMSLSHLDGDGQIDLLTAEPGDLSQRNIAIRFGTSDGFGPAVRYALPAGLSGLDATDLNDDGHPDLIGRHRSRNRVTVQMNTGTGVFGEPAGYATGRGPRSTAFADMNGDGHTDIVTANLVAYTESNPVAEYTVSILRGTSDDTFESETRYESVQSVDGLITSDFDGDGIVDIVSKSAHTSGRVHLLRGIGDGRFDEFGPWIDLGSEKQGIEGRVQSMVAGDFNGDGRADLAAGLWNQSSSAGYVAVALAKEDGVLEPAEYYALTSFPGSIVAADFNADDAIDLAVLETWDAAVRVHLGFGDGRFDRGTPYPITEQPRELIAADLDGSGTIDLAASSDDHVVTLLGAGDGAFSPPTSFEIGSLPSLQAAVDINEDGVVDLVALTWADLVSFVTPLLGDGAGGFALGRSTPIGDLAQSVTAADLDADGIVDLVTGNSQSVAVLRGVGNGFFESAFHVGPQGWDERRMVAVADFDRSGSIDIAVASRNASSVGTYLNECPSPCFGDLDRDGAISAGDINHLIERWGSCLGSCPEDLDANRSVGFTDLLLLFSAWGNC